MRTTKLILISTYKRSAISGIVSDGGSKIRTSRIKFEALRRKKEREKIRRSEKWSKVLFFVCHIVSLFSLWRVRPWNHFCRAPLLHFSTRCFNSFPRKKRKDERAARTRNDRLGFEVWSWKWWQKSLFCVTSEKKLPLLFLLLHKNDDEIRRQHKRASWKWPLFRTGQKSRGSFWCCSIALPRPSAH